MPVAPLLLAGDVGGTKTNLAVFARSDLTRPLAQTSFSSASYGSLEGMVAEFLSRSGLSVGRAAFGVAGPVRAGRAKPTRLSWQVDAEVLRQTLGLTEPVRVVNDLVATAHGIGCLPAADRLCLNPGEAESRGPLAVIAPGTGLGEAMMFWDGQRYQAQATEGGHALFSPATRQHLALAEFLFTRHGAVSFDLLASGRGLPLLYDFLKHQGRDPEPRWLAEALAAGDDPAPIVTQAGLEEGVPLCLATLRLFVELLAVEARNLALKALSTGGLFIGGGIPPRMPTVFQEAFLPLFIGQGPLRDILARMPVSLILNPHAALLGAACLAMEE